MYRVSYIQGNGYTCGCCRESWLEAVDVETCEELYAILDSILSPAKDADSIASDKCLKDVIVFKDVTNEVKELYYAKKAVANHSNIDV